VAPPRRRVEKLHHPPLVARVQRVGPQPVENLDPGLRVRLLVYARGRVLRAAHTPSVPPALQSASRPP
jgi:hypothetical protein